MARLINTLTVPILLLGFITISPSMSKKSATSDQIQQKKIVQNTFDIEGDQGVKLRVEIEYTLNTKGYLNNGCKAQFIVTNIGKTPYTWKKGAKNKIIFDFTTDDKKVFQESVTFFVDLDSGKSASSRKVGINAGLERQCISVTAVKMSR